MTTLKQARESGKIEQFTKERKGEKGDPDAFNRTLASMAGKSKEAPATSKPVRSDD